MDDEGKDSARFIPIVHRPSSIVHSPSSIVHYGGTSMKVEAKLKELGLELPGVAKTPPGVVLPFSWVRVRGNRVYVSGHGPQNPDGTMAGWGKVGAEVSLEEGYRAARLAAPSVLASL